MSAAPHAPGTRTSVAVYRRTVAAPLERVWENVYDWEHLPWLHRSSFASVELASAGDWGWRAWIGLAGPAERAIELELVRNGDSRYVSRTLDGGGAGTEVWTRVEPLDEERTSIEVDFQVPGVDPAHAADQGRTYVTLYRRLWSEDEAMMQLRHARLAARPRAAAREPVALGTLEAVRARLPLVVELAGRPCRVIELDGELVAHSTVCAHLLGPLDSAPVEDGCVRCPWHGYRYDVRTGRSADGRGLRLAPAPRLEVDPHTREVLLVPA